MVRPTPASASNGAPARRRTPSTSSISAPIRQATSTPACSPNTRYTYRVRAVTPYPSGYSEEAIVRTPRPAPGPPAGLTAAADSAYGIRLNWYGVDPNALAVAIYRGPTAAGPFTEIGLALADVNAYLDLNAEAEMDRQPVGGDPSPGQTYYYQLRAFNDTGESSATAPVPGATRGLSLARSDRGRG